MVMPYANTNLSSTSADVAASQQVTDGARELDIWTLAAGIQFGLPLLRNRGAAAFAASDRAARSEPKRGG
jgi:hypothetical protein